MFCSISACTVAACGSNDGMYECVNKEFLRLGHPNGTRFTFKKSASAFRKLSQSRFRLADYFVPLIISSQCKVDLSCQARGRAERCMPLHVSARHPGDYNAV